MKKNYYVFIEALLITIVIFVVGFYIGTAVEGNHLNQVNNYYIQSETSLVDILALNNIVGLNTTSCANLVESNKNLLNKVYTEAEVLGEYETSGKLTSDLENLHTKYDVLRTYLWINAITIKKICPHENFSTIVYLYDHDEKDLTKKAEQNVWSKLLLEIKNEDSNIMLIPIAMDSNLTSLDTLTKKYNITSSPAVIINENKTFYNIVNKTEILKSISNFSSQ